MVKTVVTMQLICAFVFANAKSRFSHDAAHFIAMAVMKLSWCFNQQKNSNTSLFAHLKFYNIEYACVEYV